MKKILGIISFPFTWISLYLGRIIIDVILGFLRLVLLVGTIRLISTIIFVPIFVISLLYDIFAGLVITFIGALKCSQAIINGTKKYNEIYEEYGFNEKFTSFLDDWNVGEGIYRYDDDGDIVEPYADDPGGPDPF